MIKKSVYLLISLLIFIITINSLSFAVDSQVSNFIKNLMSNETWVNSQFLSYDEIKYTNDPSYKAPPSCDYDRPAAIISTINCRYFLISKYESSKDLKVVLTSASIPTDESSRALLREGLRNKNATMSLILGGETATVKANLKQSYDGKTWELYIDGGGLPEGKYWIVDSFIIDDVTYKVTDNLGKNTKICSASTKTINEDENAANYYRNESYTIFDHNAQYHLEISSDKYEDNKSIPTSEKLKISGWVDNADYHIKARTTKYKAEIKNVSITVNVSYDYGKYVYNDGKKTWEIIGSGTETEKELNYSISIPERVYYDVPVSETAILIGGHVNAADDKYSLIDCDIPAANKVGNAGTNINFKENFVNIPAKITINEYIGGIGNYNYESKAKSDARSRAKALLKAKKDEIMQSLIDGLQGDKSAVNYEFYGLKVNSSGVSRNT